MKSSTSTDKHKIADSCSLFVDDYYQMDIYDYPEYLPESWMAYKSLSRKSRDAADVLLDHK